LGVLLIQKEALEKYKIPCEEIKYYVRATRGGLSGGTIASMIAISAYIKSNPSLSSLLGNPYALNSTSFNGPRVSSLRSIKWDDEVKLWLAPFVMSGINTRIVRRSNEMLKFEYGKEFLYSEVTSFSKGFKGYIKSLYMLIGLGLAKVLMSYRPTFLFLRKCILPAAGEGPSKNERENGFFKILLIGKARENKISCSVIGDRDPGYSGTAKMLTEAALSIILDQKKIPQNYGVLTPASGIGMTLINRLESKGVVFKIC
jgi:saccharopine dehydrogenase (NAD+, L-glutamate forming)